VVNVATDYRISKKPANLQDNSTDNSKAAASFPASKIVRTTLAEARSGALATLTADGAPFASLVLTATDEAGDLVMLLSRLAVHTQNLERDPRASLLVVASGGENGDPVAGGRVTVLGRADLTVSTTARARFLAGHPEAERYASFADFAFWRLEIASAHLVAGFGRIVDLKRADIVEGRR